MHANKREEVDEVHAGDICAALNLRGVRTGDTLCALEAPVVLEALHFPEPVIQLAVEARSRGGAAEDGGGTGEAAAEDPSLRVEVDPETGQQLLSGMGELHLEIVVDRLRTEYGVEARVGQPKVAYRETLRQNGPPGLPPRAADRWAGAVRPGGDGGGARAERLGAGLRG